MEKKINIAELLKNCPQGMELDCLLWDNVIFERVADDGIWIKRIDSKSGEHSLLYVYNDGSFPIHNLGSLRTKCVIFPKGKTTWEGFVPPCKFKNGDIVTRKLSSALVCCIYKERKNDASFNHHIALYDGGLGIIVNGQVVLSDNELRFATEEEKQKLFQAIKDNGYKWDNETKTLEKLVELKFNVGNRIRPIGSDRHYIIKNIKIDRYILNDNKFLKFTDEHDFELVPNKFDINTLVPFESRVLVRNDMSQLWIPAFWGYKRDNGYATTFGWSQYCIPYEGNEHLLNTANDCDIFFKIWEES